MSRSDSNPLPPRPVLVPPCHRHRWDPPRPSGGCPVGSPAFHRPRHPYRRRSRSAKAHRSCSAPGGSKRFKPSRQNAHFPKGPASLSLVLHEPISSSSFSCRHQHHFDKQACRIIPDAMPTRPATAAYPTRLAGVSSPRITGCSADASASANAGAFFSCGARLATCNPSHAYHVHNPTEAYPAAEIPPGVPLEIIGAWSWGIQRMTELLDVPNRPRP